MNPVGISFPPPPKFQQREQEPTTADADQNSAPFVPVQNPVVTHSVSASQSEASQREKVAEEMVRDSIEHVAREYIRNDIAEMLGIPSEADRFNASNSELEFHPSSPEYNTRTLILIFASLIGLLPVMGNIALCVAVAGWVCVYICDYLNYRTGSVIAMGGSLCLFGLSVVMTNAHDVWTSVGSMVMILMLCFQLAMVAALGTLQYHWIQVTLPELASAVERSLLGLTPILSLPSLLSTTVAMVGSKYAPFLFAAEVCVLHRFFYCKLESSFFRKKAVDGTMRRVVLTGFEEAALFTAGTVVLPLVCYLTMQSNMVTYPSLHAVNAIAMLAIPVLYLFGTLRTSLWFLIPEVKPLQEEPLGLYPMLSTIRTPLLAVSYFCVLHWAVFRVLHSRFQYLFVGVGFPFNAVLLSMILYGITAIVILARKVLESKEKGTYSGNKISVLMLSIFVAIMIAVVTGMPSAFHPMSALAASSFNAFLMDRRNGSSFGLFAFCSSFLLLWWMHKTFSMVVMDLHVLGESHDVPTPVLAIGVLWTYVLSCIVFSTSFSKNRARMVMFMGMHWFQVWSVEHILYSQNEAGVYPAVLVLVTSAVGCALAFRLHKNGILDERMVDVFCGMYGAKLLAYLSNITAIAYADSIGSETHFDKKVRAIDHLVGVGTGCVMCAMVVRMELLRRKKETPSPNTLWGFAAAATVTCFTYRNNIVVALVNSLLGISMSEVSLLETYGGVLVLLGVISWAVFTRYASSAYALRNSFFIATMIGLALVVVTPLFEPIASDSEHDFNIQRPKLALWSAAAIPVLLAMSKAFSLVSTGIMFLFLVLTTISAGIALSLQLVPMASVILVLTATVFLVSFVVSVMLSHYRNLQSYELYVIFGVGLAAMVLMFVELGRIDFHSGNAHFPQAMISEIQEEARFSLLAFTSCANIVIAVILKARLSGRPLLAGAIGLTEGMVEQVGLVCNYSALLGTILMFILNFWAGEGSAAIYATTSMFLLLLVDDNMLFEFLHKDGFRYFPVLVAWMSTLWTSLIVDAVNIGRESSVWGGFATLLCALPMLPSNLSLLARLYWGERAGLSAILVAVIIFIDITCLLISSRPVIQWLAIVGVCGQAFRLFNADSWSKSSTLL